MNEYIRWMNNCKPYIEFVTRPSVVAALLASAIVFPLLGSGELIVTLHFPGLLEWDVSSYFQGMNAVKRNLFTAGLNTAFISIFIKVLDLDMPLWFLQGLWIWLSLWLCAVGASRLPFIKGIGRYYAGAIYMVNPFTYMRLLAGDWGVLTGYALVPIAVSLMVNMYRGGKLSNGIWLAILLTVIAVFNIQVLFVTGLISGLVFLVINLGCKQRIKALKTMGASLGMFVLLNLFWAVPFFILKVSDSGLAPEELALLGPKALEGQGALVTMATLHGYWRGNFPLGEALTLTLIRTILYSLIAYIALVGVFSNKGDRIVRLVTISLVLIGAVGFLMALGWNTSVPIVGAIWRTVLIPLGFWDTNVFIGMLVLAFAYLGGLGVDDLKGFLDRFGPKATKVSIALLAMCSFIPVVYTFQMFQLSSQMGPSIFPEDWYTVREKLDSDTDSFNVLVLPWKFYMTYSWLENKEKTAASPAPMFFNQPIIVPDKVITPSLFSEPQNSSERYVEFLLDRRYEVTNLGELVAPLNVKYIVLLHEVDYKQYEFLRRQVDINIDMELDGLTLFKNTHPRAFAYGVNGVIGIRNWTELVELSRTEEIMESVLPVEETGRYVSPSGFELFQEVGEPFGITDLNEMVSRWVVLSVPPGIRKNGWSLNGEGPIAMNLGFMPVFEAQSNADITYRPFLSLYMPLYFISTGALIFGLIFLLGGPIKKLNFKKMRLKDLGFRT